MKFTHEVSEICKRTNRQTDQHWNSSQYFEVKIMLAWFLPHEMVVWLSDKGIGDTDEVTLRRARLVLILVTVHGYAILVCNYQLGPTQPSTLSGMENEYRPNNSCSILVASSRGCRACRSCWRGCHEDATRKLQPWNSNLSTHGSVSDEAKCSSAYTPLRCVAPFTAFVSCTHGEITLSFQRGRFSTREGRGNPAMCVRAKNKKCCRR